MSKLRDFNGLRRVYLTRGSCWLDDHAAIEPLYLCDKEWGLYRMDYIGVRLHASV